MNQILQSHNEDFFGESSTSHSKTISTKKIFIIQFFLCLIVMLIAIMIYFISKYNAVENEKVSKQLMNNFSITTLYANQTTNSAVTPINITENLDSPFVIGLIKIDKIKLMYPILSITTNEFLKIAPCRFEGPLPNQIGNLCIAGHNYVDNKLFSNVHKLQEGDVIQIYGLDGNVLEYIVFFKTEVANTDLTYTSQETNNTKQITLITCNNVLGTRVIVQAKEKGR